MIRTFQYKIYPNQTQQKTLSRWLSVCCWLYNLSLEHRIKAWKRRKEFVTYNHQQSLLTKQRGRIDSLRMVPAQFERDALRRVDRGFKAFFRRVKAGQTPGFPRFRACSRYNSMECLQVAEYLRGDRIRVPNLGTIRCRGRLLPEGVQRGVCVIRRQTGWYAQVILDDGQQSPSKREVQSTVGVDVGLASFATLSNGTKIENQRWMALSASKLRSLRRRVSRRKKGSNRRLKAVAALARRHERVALQRRNFCHQHSTALVQQFDLIAVENLNVRGMSRSRLGKSILDAAWSTFLNQLARKAEYAGVQLVAVDPCGTSQECPSCGRIVKKSLSERTHRCVCGLVCDRDHAAAQVILARALGGHRGVTPVERTTSRRRPVVACQVDSMKREGLLDAKCVN